MKKHIKIALLLITVVFVFSSCLSVDIESRINDKVVSMTPIPEEIEHKIVGSFDEELRVFFTINGLVATSQLEIDGVIRTAIEKYHGDGVVNFKVNDKLSGIDILIQSGLSVGGYLIGMLFAPDTAYIGTFGSLGASTAQFCLQSRTVTISGDVFKLE